MFSFLAIEYMVEIDSRSSPILLFIDIILVKKKFGKENLVPHSSPSSSCLEQFNVIGWKIVRFLWLDER